MYRSRSYLRKRNERLAQMILGEKKAPPTIIEENVSPFVDQIQLSSKKEKGKKKPQRLQEKGDFGSIDFIG